MQTRKFVQIAAVCLATTIACAGCGGAAGPSSTTTATTKPATIKPAKSKYNAGYNAVPPAGDLTFEISFVVPEASCTSGSSQYEGINPEGGVFFNHKSKSYLAVGDLSLHCYEGGMLPDGLTIAAGTSSNVLPQGSSPVTGDHIVFTVTVTPSSSQVTYLDLTHRHSASVSGPGGEPTDIYAAETSYATSQTNIYPLVKVGKVTFDVTLDGKKLTVGHELQATDLVSKDGKVEVTTSPLSGGTTFTTTQ